MKEAQAAVQHARQLGLVAEQQNALGGQGKGGRGMSDVEWDQFYWLGFRAESSRGVFAVRPVATRSDARSFDLPEGGKGWQWEWQPPAVSGVAESKEQAKAAAVAASVASRRVEWVQEIGPEKGEWSCAVAFGCWMRVQQGKPRLPPMTDDAEWDARPDGWVYSVYRGGERIADGWTKTRDEARTAAELAASASEADK